MSEDTERQTIPGTSAAPRKAEELRKRRLEILRALASVGSRRDMDEIEKLLNQERHAIEDEMRTLGLDISHPLQPLPFDPRT